MPERLPPSRDAAAQAAIAAAFLGLGRTLERGGLLLTGAALLALVVGQPALLPRLGLYLAVAAGLVAHFYALRTAFDRPLFAAWARHWQEPEADPAADLAAFDAALAAAGLRPAAAGPLRPLADRIAGARRLLRRQGLCFILQIVGWLAALLAVALIP